MSLAAGAVSFRPVRDQDKPFLARLYASTRLAELDPLPWTPADKDAFLGMQFEAQTRFYDDRFPDAERWVVELDGRPAGRLYLDRRADEVRVLDIALLPEHRGGGIGTALMRDVIEEARSRGRTVRIHVERSNPALRLYGRLGFVAVEDRGVYHLMELAPPAPPQDPESAS